MTSEVKMPFKKKLENYWFYYKAHTIFGVFVLIFFVITAVQCARRVEYDMSFAYVSSEYVSSELLSQSLREIVPDVNGDGEINIFIDPIIIPEKPTTEADFNMLEKLTVTFVDGGTRIFIMDREYFETEMFAEMFQPLESITDKGLENGLRLNGKTIAVPTTECDFLVKNNMSRENLYVGFLAVTAVDSGNKNIDKIFNASETIMKELLK